MNLGLLALLVSIPIINQALIFSGGTLIFIATTLLLVQLQGMRSTAVPQPVSGGGAGRKFYIAGLSYFLVGILVGTGLWLGWSDWLRIQVPIEVHIHANNWGLLSLVFAGLLVDLYPTWAKRPLAWPRSITPIFWMLTIGALGLVLGPWVKSNWFSVPGIILFLAATFWLLLNVIKPLWGDKVAWSQPGLWHLVTAYFWILAPVLVATATLLGFWGMFVFLRWRVGPALWQQPPLKLWSAILVIVGFINTVLIGSLGGSALLEETAVLAGILMRGGIMYLN